MIYHLNIEHTDNHKQKPDSHEACVKARIDFSSDDSLNFFGHVDVELYGQGESKEESIKTLLSNLNQAGDTLTTDFQDIIKKTNEKFTQEPTKNIGVYIGKFAPLHAGHKYIIEYAFKKCDTLLILLSYDNRWLKKQNPNIWHELSLVKRESTVAEFIRRLKEYHHKHDTKYRNHEIILRVVEESDIPEYPLGWKEFCDLCAAKFRECNLTPNLMFGSEPNDIEEYKKYFPNIEYECVDPKRKKFNVSSTNIREHMADVEMKKQMLDEETKALEDKIKYADWESLFRVTL